MIELIFTERCNGCSQCVTVCPSNVLALGSTGTPYIAAQADCQTCFMCELYCHSDALYVHPDCEQPVSLDPAQVLASGLPGQYRRDSGWDEFASDPRYENQHWRMEGIFGLARELATRSTKPASAPAATTTTSTTPFSSHAAKQSRAQSHRSLS